MALPRRQRFHLPGDDPEAKRAREEKALAECAGLVLNNNPDIYPKTKEWCEVYMDEWRE
jgi:hypothetical protein